MVQMPVTRIANPRVGLFLGIFTSFLVAIAVVALLVEQLGVSPHWIGLGLFTGSIALFAAFGIGVMTRDPFDFFVAGRRVPAAINGATMAITALGGVGIVSLTGALFAMGSDAYALLLGIPAGLVVMAVLLAPFLRKFGAFTIAGYLGVRLDSHVVRIVAATLLAVPTLLMLVAELYLAITIAGRLTGLPQVIIAVMLAGVLVATLAGGGIRAQSWSGAAQAVAVVLVLVLPVTIASLALANLPLPQVTAGNVARNILRLELFRGVPILQASPWMIDVPGVGLEALGRRFLQMFGSIGASAYSLVIVAVLAGIAGMPSLLTRPALTPSVVASRTSMAWAVLATAFLILTMTAVAVFLRAYVTEQVLAQPADGLPGWFQALMQQGTAAISVRGNTLVSLGAISFTRDGVLAALPVAIGLPQGFVALTLMGALAACLAAASAHLMVVSASLSEDILLGSDPDTVHPTSRLLVARLSVAAVAGVATALALFQSDPLLLFLWALTVSASASFPVLVLSVLWKRLTAFGALAGMLAGFVLAVTLVLLTQMDRLDMTAPLPAVIAMPVAFLTAVLVSLVTPAASRHAQELLRDMRVPGGETLMDRRRRLQRLKQGE